MVAAVQAAGDRAGYCSWRLDGAKCLVLFSGHNILRHPQLVSQ